MITFGLITTYNIIFSDVSESDDLGFLAIGALPTFVTLCSIGCYLVADLTG